MVASKSCFVEVLVHILRVSPLSFGARFAANFRAIRNEFIPELPATPLQVGVCARLLTNAREVAGVSENTGARDTLLETRSGALDDRAVGP